jgi:hypothetical protein
MLYLSLKKEQNIWGVAGIQTKDRVGWWREGLVTGGEDGKMLRRKGKQSIYTYCMTWFRFKTACLYFGHTFFNTLK